MFSDTAFFDSWFLKVLSSLRKIMIRNPSSCLNSEDTWYSPDGKNAVWSVGIIEITLQLYIKCLLDSMLSL